MAAQELHGYTKVGDNTFPNLVPILTGLHAFGETGIDSKKDYLDVLPLIQKQYMQHGYVTGFDEDLPHIGAFHYNKKVIDRSMRHLPETGCRILEK